METDWAAAITIAGVGFATVISVLAVLAVLLFATSLVIKKIEARGVGITLPGRKEER